MMDYQAAVNWVLSFADYERWPGFAYAARFDLRRMEVLLSQLGNPHLGRKTVHIAGSKGKGSTAAMIASGLQAADFTVGLYTSPHLHTIRERMTLDFQPIAENDFARLVERLRPKVEAINRGSLGELTTFEILTALGFLCFQEARADFQVVEVGLGGRLDATNVVQPEICVITSISHDHTQVLGEDLTQIAAEKAGIIKPGTLTVVAPQRPDVVRVIEEFCHRRGSRLLRVGEQVVWREREVNPLWQSAEISGLRDNYEIRLPLLGEHQLENAAMAVAVLETLGLPPDAITTGLARVSWPGRLEVLAREPWLIADGAHNADSAAKLVKALKRHFRFAQAILIFAASGDKDIRGMVKELAPFFDPVIITRSRHPRAADPLKLAREFENGHVQAQVTENVEQALAEAQALAGKEDLICVTGSLFVVAEARSWAKGLPMEYYPSPETAALKKGEG